jgi:hypothetical protein
MLIWSHLGRRKGGAIPEPVTSNADALKEIEERIRPNLGNPRLLEVYRQEAERLRELSEEDLVYIDRVDPGRGAAAELTRRGMEATRTLSRSLHSADNRIYWLTVVLTLYTVALLVATILIVLKAR